MDIEATSGEQPLQAIQVSTLKLREKIREYTKSDRKYLRAKLTDSLRFGVGEIKARIQELESLTEKDVIGLARRIKRRKHATCEDMYRLSHAFLQDLQNIETFSKIPGALQVLIKELTGNNSERQLSSAECLCNLSLGEAPVCEKIASMAGSYLVTYLHNSEFELVQLSLWTLANILSTGHKGGLILMNMQLLPQLWKLYVDDSVADRLSDFREDSAICLQLLALNSACLLRNVDRDYLLHHFTEKNANSLAGEYHLQIIFHSLFSQIDLVESFSSSQQLYLINCCLNNLCNTKYFQTTEQKLKILYSVRVLSNILAVHSACYLILLQQLSSVWHINLVVLFNNLFLIQNQYLTQEALWFLKNVLHLENTFPLTRDHIVEKINISKICLGNLNQVTNEELMSVV